MATMAMADHPVPTLSEGPGVHPWPWRRIGWATAWNWARQRLPHALNAHVFLAAAAFDQIRITARAPLDAAAVRVLARLHRDPVWRRAWHRDATWDSLERAGLLDDGFSVGQVDRWRQGWAGPSCSPWLTPDSFTRHDLILRVPGSFAPVHSGHQAMVAAAVTRAHALGYRVIAVVLSPAHDAYVLRKPGAHAWSLPRRLAVLRATVGAWKAVVGVPVVVDPWEGQGVPGLLNHTDVTKRYQTTWQALHPGHRVRVGLVAGADNAGFALTATRHQPVFIAGRPGWPWSTRWPRGAWGCPCDVALASRTYRQTVTAYEASPEACGVSSGLQGRN
jgi:hypothetical protein